MCGDQTMNVSECMTPEVQVASPNLSLSEAARLMGEFDVGVLPVAEDNRLIGMVTDRDIAIRGVAMGRGPDSKVREVMSEEVQYCFDDESIEEVARSMGDLQVRRLPVVSGDGRLVGIVSLGDIAQHERHDVDSNSALREISRSGGERTQTLTGSN
jgi:CBS domain-containing protein